MVLLYSWLKNIYFLTDNHFLFYSIFKCFDIIQKYRGVLFFLIELPQCRKSPCRLREAFPCCSCRLFVEKKAIKVDVWMGSWIILWESTHKELFEIACLLAKEWGPLMFIFMMLIKIIINLSLLSLSPSFRTLKSSVFGKLQADYLRLRAMCIISIGVHVLFVLAFPLLIVKIYVLWPFDFAIGLILNHHFLKSRLTWSKWDFGDCLRLGRVFCLLKIGVLAEVVREAVLYLLIVWIWVVDALLHCLRLFFWQFIAYRQQILRDFFP